MTCPPTLALALLACLAACASPPGPPTFRDADYPGVLRPPRDLGIDVVWRQRVTATWASGERGFDAAIQNQANVLTVLGLSPVGAPGFVFQLDDQAVSVKNDSGERLPFPPRFILLDVQRVFFPWLGDGVGIFGPREDGDYEAEQDGELVREVWRRGRLQERSFERLDGAPAGRIHVAYQWDEGQTAPRRAVLDNGWFGYSLAVETIEEHLLPQPSEPTDGTDG